MKNMSYIKRMTKLVVESYFGAAYFLYAICQYTIAVDRYM